jgi:hypothetical protein
LFVKFFNPPGGRGINSPPLGAIINIPIDTPLLAAGQSILRVYFNNQKLASRGSVGLDNAGWLNIDSPKIVCYSYNDFYNNFAKSELRHISGCR